MSQNKEQLTSEFYEALGRYSGYFTQMEGLLEILTMILINPKEKNVGIAVISEIQQQTHKKFNLANSLLKECEYNIKDEGLLILKKCDEVKKDRNELLHSIFSENPIPGLLSMDILNNTFSSKSYKRTISANDMVEKASNLSILVDNIEQLIYRLDAEINPPNNEPI